MKELFFLYLQAGLWGSILILAVVLFRLVLRRLPRRMICLLWVFVLLRLLIPVQIRSPLSLQPQLDFQTVTQETQTVPDVPAQDTLAPSPTVTYPAGTMPPQTQATVPSTQPEKPQTDYIYHLSVLWAAGAAAAISYALVTYLLFKHSLSTAIPYKKGILEHPAIPGPFVLGYFKPRIYLPMQLPAEDRDYILFHEKTHITYGDHWFKLLSFLTLCLHWYNPFVWVAYLLICRDIEIACDESVVKNLTLEERKLYSLALLNCAMKLSRLPSCPVAFGEVDLKQRIKKVLKYKKPVLWCTVVACVLAVVIAVCFLTTPPKKQAQAEPPSTREEPTENTQPQSPSVEPTVPGTTEPGSTEPSATTTLSESSTQEQPMPPASTLVDTLPSYMAGCDTQPLPNSAEHTHNYSATVYAPSCYYAGYTMYECSCDHVYYSNIVPAAGHVWVFSKELTDANSMGSNIYKCQNCIETKMDVTYTTHESYDLEGIDQRATQYAASFGFQTLENGPNRTAAHFDYSHRPYVIAMDGGESFLNRTALSLVDTAVTYCQQNGYVLSESCVWVEVYYDPPSDYIYIKVYCATVG